MSGAGPWAMPVPSATTAWGAAPDPAVPISWAGTSLVPPQFGGLHWGAGVSPVPSRCGGPCPHLGLACPKCCHNPEELCVVLVCPWCHCNLEGLQFPQFWQVLGATTA